ncbi:hypothetical protein [Rhodanobacter lindaniclasticus]
MAYAIYIYGVFDVRRDPLARFPLPDFGCEYGSDFCSGVVLPSRCVARARGWLTAVLVVAGALMVVLDDGYAALFLLLPWGVIRSVRRPRRGFAATGYGDFSYGIYIYAFMMQQLAIPLIGANHPYWLGLTVSAACTCLCRAFVAQRERPSLDLKRHLPGASGMANGPGAFEAVLPPSTAAVAPVREEGVVVSPNEASP